MLPAMADDVVVEFLVESNENLDSLDRELVQLEKDPSNRSTLASIFRTIHTIKGTCGFLGFTKLESVAHVGENLLSKLRDGELQLHPEITTALLRMVDAIRQMLQSIESSGAEGERNDADLIETLTKLQQGGAVTSTMEINVAPPPIASTPLPTTPSLPTNGHARLPALPAMDLPEVAKSAPAEAPRGRSEGAASETVPE